MKPVILLLVLIVLVLFLRMLTKVLWFSAASGKLNINRKQFVYKDDGPVYVALFVGCLIAWFKIFSMLIDCTSELLVILAGKWQ